MLVKHTIDWDGNVLKREIIDENTEAKKEPLLGYYIGELKKNENKLQEQLYHKDPASA